jgi:hypothetical protein
VRARREVEVVAAVLALRAVGGPHLLVDPGHVLGADGDAVVRHLAALLGEREDVVVDHVVLVALVVEAEVVLAVVAGVDVDLAVEDVRRRVGRVDVRHEGLGHGAGSAWSGVRGTRDDMVAYSWQRQ